MKGEGKGRHFFVYGLSSIENDKIPSPLPSIYSFRQGGGGLFCFLEGKGRGEWSLFSTFPPYMTWPLSPQLVPTSLHSVFGGLGCVCVWFRQFPSLPPLPPLLPPTMALYHFFGPSPPLSHPRSPLPLQPPLQFWNAMEFFLMGYDCFKFGAFVWGVSRRGSESRWGREGGGKGSGWAVFRPWQSETKTSHTYPRLHNRHAAGAYPPSHPHMGCLSFPSQQKAHF